MNFKQFAHWFLFSILVILLSACSDEAKETELVNLHATADQDVIAIEFPASTETVVSINSLTSFSVQGIKSNGVDRVSLASQIDWSLSNGAASKIDQNGRLTAAATAESITIYAKLGIVSASIDIRVSDAVFEQVISLNKEPVTLDMCQSQTITPIGRYVGSLGVEERKVDNTVIGNIEWTILKATDNSPSQSAYIQTVGNTTTLYSLAPEELIIQAQETGNPVTASFNQTIGDGLSSIKICSSGTTDYASCSVTSPEVEQDKKISFIAIGQYTSGSYQNISRTSKWGISNSNMSAILSSDLQQIEITGGEVPNETLSIASNLSVACGDIVQSITGDITQGIILDSDIACNADCQRSSTDITINQLTVETFDVTANENPLTSNESINLDLQPAEIKLVVKVTFSNGEERDITLNTSLTDSIINVDGQVVIEGTDTLRTYKVLKAGTAKIQLDYRDEKFYAVIEIPETP